MEGLSKKVKRTPGHGQKCGACWGKGYLRGLNGVGEKYNKKKKKKENELMNHLIVIGSDLVGTQERKEMHTN